MGCIHYYYVLHVQKGNSGKRINPENIVLNFVYWIRVFNIKNYVLILRSTKILDFLMNIQPKNGLSFAVTIKTTNNARVATLFTYNKSN